MKTADQIKYNCEGDIGEEQKVSYKESHMWWLMYLSCVKVPKILPYQTEKVTTIWTVRQVLLGKSLDFVFLYLIASRLVQ